MKELCSKIMDLKIRQSPLHYQVSNLMFRLETEHGLPAEIFKDNFPISIDKDDWTIITEIYLEKITEHKTKSGISDKRLKELQQRNKTIMSKLLENGELETI